MKRVWYLCPSIFTKEYSVVDGSDEVRKYCIGSSKKDPRWVSVFVAEMVATFIMANCFLNIRSLNKYQDNLFNPLFIALATLISLLMTQHVPEHLSILPWDSSRSLFKISSH